MYALPRLFNVYADEIIEEVWTEKKVLKINGKRINETSYANDKVIIVETGAQM